MDCSAGGRDALLAQIGGQTLRPSTRYLPPLARAM
jgi:hypothetical protein